MNEYDGTWHLHTKSSFEHRYHVPTEEDVSTLSKKDLSDDHRSALNILFQSGIAPSVIAKVMTELVHMSSDKKGVFDRLNPLFSNIFIRHSKFTTRTVRSCPFVVICLFFTFWSSSQILLDLTSTLVYNSISNIT